LNILFLSELFYPHGGGAELATYLYAKLLAEAKTDVVVITNRFVGEPEFSFNEGFKVYRLPLFDRTENVKYSILKRVDVLFSSFMRKWIKWADVVYVPRFWFSAIPLAKAYKKPVIVHLHDYIPICPLATFYNFKEDRVCDHAFCSVDCIYRGERRKRGLLKSAGSTFLNMSVWRFLRKCISQADAVICVSKAQRNILAKSAPWLAPKLRVIYNPLPPLSPWPINGDYFGYFGGTSYVKGFNVLLRALEYRKLQGHKSIFVYGTKFSSVGQHFINYLRHIGFLANSKLSLCDYERVYSKIKAVIVPSIWQEPLPYIVSEALLRGRLVIASKTGGIPELLGDCKGAFMINLGEYKQLAELLDYVSAMSKSYATELGLENRQVFLDRFSKHSPLKEFFGILSDV